MKNLKIQVPFGPQAYKECKEKSKVNGKIDAEKFYWAMVNYQLDGLMTELKNQGYRSIGRGRVIFEEACDWQARINVTKIVKILKMTNWKKIPKFTEFEIGDEIPKVE